MSTIHATKTHAARPSTASKSNLQSLIVAIRRWVGAGNEFSDVAERDVPKPVAAYLKKMKHTDHDADLYYSVQTLQLGHTTFYAVDSDNEGNGYTDIVSKNGKYITGYSYSESEGPNWNASPMEAAREKQVGDAASKIFTRSALGTPKLAKYSVTAAQLPEALKKIVANWNVTARGYYKVNLAGKEAYALYAHYSGTDNKPRSSVGDVTLYDAKGSWLGSANVYNSGEQLKFGLNLGRAGE
jgi:hypothetical protein